MRAWAAGAQNDSLYRTNVGVFLPAPPAQGSLIDFEVIVRDSTGTEITRGTMPFPAAGMQQMRIGIWWITVTVRTARRERNGGRDNVEKPPLRGCLSA